MRQKAAGWHFTTCIAEAPFSPKPDRRVLSGRKGFEI
jgi:hypothetical protein